VSEINRILGKYKADITQTIKGLANQAPPEMAGIIGYHFGWLDQDFRPAHSSSGKMFRPAICLLVYESITGEYQPALPVAASIEIIHNFSLLHDDIEDNDVERRGRPTAWTIWGQPRVINVGDYVFSMAYRALHLLDPAQIPLERILAIHQLINNACIELTEGQDADIRFETLPEVSTEMYLDMVYKKTGVLVEAAILSGAKAATSDETIIQNYANFAQNIGLAFQIRDDVLGIWGDSTETGKSTKNDIRKKKKTLPVLYTLGQVSGERKKKMTSYYAQPEPLTDPEIEFVRECLEWADARSYAQAVAETYRQKSFDALDRIGAANPAQVELKMVAEFLINRSY
jgi:geranylgeranyl diphosphate synthase type I